jgi:hypothetical protein
MRTLLPVWGCGLPYLQGPKATKSGVDRQHRQRGGQNPGWVLLSLPSLSPQVLIRSKHGNF